MMYSERELKDFDYWKIPRPAHKGHATDSLEKPISENMRSLNPRNWRQSGNVLTADTDWGEFHQTIPVHKILTGTDGNGLPILENVVYSNS